MVPKITADMTRLYQGLRAHTLLEKQAAAATPTEREELFTRKVAAANHLFEFIKTSGVLDGVKTVAKDLGGKALTGGAIAAGAAIPATLAVNAMSDHATASARDRALQTGVGLAGLGAGMYGLHRMVSSDKHAASDEEIEDTLLKLASVGHLDEALTDTLNDKSLTADAHKLAAELRSLNREFGIEILKQLTA